MNAGGRANLKGGVRMQVIRAGVPQKKPLITRLLERIKR